MQKSLQNLDQVLLDNFNCYYLISIDKENNLYLSTNFSDRENSIEQLANLYIQLKSEDVLKSVISSSLMKMNNEEIRKFVSYIVKFSEILDSDPILQPIQNHQKSAI